MVSKKSDVDLSTLLYTTTIMYILRDVELTTLLYTTTTVYILRVNKMYIYSSTHEYNEMTDPAKTSSTPTKTHTLLQSLYVHPNTYS
jgi:hypothetical protein